jgi:hypothetical protein
VRALRKPVALLALVALVAAGCSGDGEEPGPEPGHTSPPPSETTSENGGSINRTPGTYDYANAGLNVEMVFEAGASGGTLTVVNDTGRALPKPGLYVRQATDGKQVDGRVLEAAPIPDGEQREFRVEFPPEVNPDSIGLLILLIGGDNYGAFVHQ